MYIGGGGTHKLTLIMGWVGPYSGTIFRFFLSAPTLIPAFYRGHAIGGIGRSSSFSSIHVVILLFCFGYEGFKRVNLSNKQILKCIVG